MTASLSLSYDQQLSRVRVSASGLVDAAEYTLERSTDQVRWTTVRGGQSRHPSGGISSVDDYEFAADVANFYRLRGPRVADDYERSVGAGGWGTTTSGTATTVVAGTPSDFSVAGGEGRIATTTVNATYYNGFDVGSADQRLRTTARLPVMPTGAPITLRAAVRVTDSNNFYNASVFIDTFGSATVRLSKNVAGAGSNISGPVAVGTHAVGDRWTILVEVSGSTVRAKAWNASTSAEPDSWQVSTTDISLTTGTLAAVGTRRESGNTNGTVTASFDDTVAEEPRTTTASDDITPTLDSVWLKSVARPFLNRTVRVRGYSPFTRPPRAGIFDVVNRSNPVAVTDVRGSKRFTLEVYADDAADARNLDLLLASGDILFIHVPTTGRLSTVPGGYVSVGETTETVLPTHDLRQRVFALPCTMVAALGPEVVGVSYTWQGLVNDYATWADVVAAFATWADLLETVGSPEDVIVQ